MKQVILRYKILLFILWTLLSVFLVATMPNTKDLYIFFTLLTFPLSFFSVHVIDAVDLSGVSIVLVGYLTGCIQWAVLVGGLMDRFALPISIEAKDATLIKVNRSFFTLGVFGLILSAITIQDAYMSATIYNIALAVVACSIGVKVLFLDKKATVQ